MDLIFNFFINVGKYYLKFRDRSVILPGDGGKRHLGRGLQFCTLKGRKMKNSEHFERRSMPFFWSAGGLDQDFTWSCGGRENSIKYKRILSTPSL